MADTSFVESTFSKRSTTVILIYGRDEGLIFWKANKQSTIKYFTIEVEIKTATNVTEYCLPTRILDEQLNKLLPLEIQEVQTYMIFLKYGNDSVLASLGRNE